MTQKLKSLALAFAMIIAAFAPTLLAAPAYAVNSTNPDIGGNLCAGASLDPTGTDTSCDSSGSLNLQTLLSTIINYFSIFVGVIAVIMIIVGGLQYITSGGDSGKVGKAKTTIIYALVGLVVVALAQLVVRFVLNQVGSAVTGQ